MGIRGLYSYIQEFADASLAWHKLRNCKLVIDGNNLAHEIYGNSPGINPAFGGDYDKYAVYIENFSIKCNVDPIVIMDGGYPMLRNKFKTVYSRLTDQMDTCRKINPDNQDSMKVFPIMARSVFVFTIHKLGVRVLQADFEADDEIVVVAKELGAYVLSNDSDFYIFDVPFILLHSVNMKHVQKEQIKGGKISKFIPCYRFDTEKFCKITGVRRELIPLLAPLLGNDYFNAKCMLPFYKTIFHLRPNSKKISARKKVIISVLRWLANQDGSPDDIINKIVNAKDLSKYFTPGTRNGLRKAFEMYFPSSSYFTPWISQHEKTCFVKSAESSDANSEIKYSVNFEEYFLGSQNLIEELRCTCKSKSDSTILSNGELPDKFLRAFRLGLIPHGIVDFLTKDYFFTVPQIEAYERECLYVTFFELIKDLRALLWITYARGSENRNSETINKNLAILYSNVPNKSSKQVSSIETNNTVESNKENEKTDELIQVSGGDYKEIDEDIRMFKGR
ncbi:Protein asteroid [Armadillidium vulgare]|nr:Protein asteroid [Armadillidium vulgare]